MLILIKQLINLLTPSQRRRLYILQILVVMMAFSEILGVASVGPFIALVSNPEIIYGDNLLARLYQISGFSQPNDFIFFTGFTILVALFLAAFLSIVTVWRLALFSSRVGAEIGDRLYKYYLYQNWLFHASGSSAQLTKQIASETTRVTGQILNPILQINAKVVLAFFMVIALSIYNPLVTFSALVIFSISYIVLYRIVRKRLAINGQRISKVSTDRFKLLSESFGGIKELLLLGRQQDYLNRFKINGEQLADGQGTNQALAQAPKYFMELVAYSSIILLVLYLKNNYAGNLELMLPVLAVYALAGFKLLPAFQAIYVNVAAIKGGMAAFESVRVDLENSKKQISLDSNQKDRVVNSLSLGKGIALHEVTFTYPGKPTPALDKLSIYIPVNKTVGLVGPSGSGKSTAMDLILGLIQPDSGYLLIDDKPLAKSQIRNWQDNVGFVPQSIFLADASIIENIAFGLSRANIDISRIERAIALSHLKEFVDSLPEGLNTRIGERGVQLSGGQRQRIGIARSLYHQAEVLILDEATSALDGITESLVMNAINNLSGEKTIIMIAHRLKTIERCDIIYFIKDGKVVDDGTYAELIARNTEFRKMAAHA